MALDFTGSTPLPGGDAAAGGGRLHQLLARRGLSLREAEDGIRSASDAELMPFGLRAYRLNILSLMGKSWSRTKVFEAARQAAISKMLGGWEHHHHYLPRLTAASDRPCLDAIPVDRVRGLLARGRGLVVMSFHLGHMRLLATDLAHSGIPICLPLASDAFSNYRTARIANPTAGVWSHLRIVNVEERAGSLSLARVLAGGGCILSSIDGNTGLDGPLGHQRRSTVRLLEAKASVKTGLFDMAARFGSPILITVACTQDGKRVCTTAPVIDPGGPLAGEESRHFVETAVRDAYAFFGATLMEHADEWCGGDLFHQWRVAEERSPDDPAAVEHDLTARLAQGDSLVLDHRRILPLESDGDIVWSDAVSGKCYRLPGGMAAMAEQLSCLEAGVDTAWLRSHSDIAQSRLWPLLCFLASRGAITTRAQIMRQSH